MRHKKFEKYISFFLIMDSKTYKRRSEPIRRRRRVPPEPLKQKPAPKATKASPPSFAKGGVVKKTGLAKVHKGEVVLTAAQAKRMKALFS